MKKWQERVVDLVMDPGQVRALWVRATHVAGRPPKGYLTGKPTSFQLRARGGAPPFAVVSVAWGKPSTDGAVVHRVAWDAAVANQSDAWKAFDKLVGQPLRR
jgi:hypothetical protein